MPANNAASAKRYKARQAARGRVRLDVWVSKASAEKLRALKTPLDRTLGKTLERLIAARRSKRLNFRQSLSVALKDVLG